MEDNKNKHKNNDNNSENIPIDFDNIEKNNTNSSIEITQTNDENLPEKHYDSSYAFRWKYEEEKTKRPPNRKSGNPLFILTLIMSVTFLFTFVIFAISIASHYESISTSAEAAESAVDDGGDQKTIFIKEFDSKSGALTPQEIYASCLDSVVSIQAFSKNTEGIGSGFIYSADGYIATAHHVIADMNEINVILSDGSKHKAELVASNDLCDLALLKIETDGLKAVSFGSSSSLLVGEELVAIGTPASLDFAGTMTRGDLSYNARRVYIYDDESGDLKKKMTLLQTSAALNPGNSGGPVFDIYGKVVGIVTMKLGDGFDGIGFAIPTDAAIPILEDMKNGNTPSRDKLSAIASQAARLGIMGISAKKGDTLGVEIREISECGGDADEKLCVGDLITSLADKAIDSTETLALALAKHDPEDIVAVTVLRSGQLLTFNVILGQ